MAVIIRCTRCNTKVRAVESVLSRTFRCPQCGKKLRLAESNQPAEPDPLVGKKFAHYQIEEKVGEGAMAVVYRARNIPLDKIVAIKILSEEATVGPLDSAERFLAEARSAASLDHMNVLSVYYVGKYEDRYFIEMQYADGGTVREALNAKGKFDARTAARVAHDAACGLAAAHRKMIIHRDVKPQNLMLTTEGVVKVADFGLAKLQDAEKKLMAAGLTVGTPLYMAPEQVAGKAVDERADIYSLGIAFFEMVTGRPPFEALTSDAVLQMHSHEEVPSPQIYVPEIPDAVCAIIAKMTRKKPAERYSSCKELIEDLENFLASSAKASAPATGEDADAGPILEVDDLDIFRTMARYAFVSGGTRDQVIRDLRRKARDLNIAKEEADRIVSQMQSECEAAQPVIRMDAQEVRVDLERAATERLRRQQRQEILAGLARWAGLLAVVLVLLGAAYAVRSVINRTRAAYLARQETEKEEKRETSAERIFEEGKKSESRADWKAAVKSYRESLRLRDDEKVRERLAVVLKTLDAIELETQQKWDEAEKAFEEVLPETLDRGHISPRIERIQNVKSYESTYAAAKSAYERGEWAAAAEGFRRAAELAMKASVPTDAVDLANDAQARIDAEQQRRAEMERLIEICRQKKNAYALFAACSFYLGSPAHSLYRDDLLKAKEEAKTAIDSMITEGPKEPVEETNNFCFVKLKKGEAFYGKLLSKKEKAVEVEPIGEEKDVRRLIHVDDIDSLDSITAKDINNMRAEEVCRDLGAAWKAGRPFEVLQLIGKLMTKFSDTKIVTSAEDQKSLLGEPMSDLLAKAVPECVEMCPECEGKGYILCDECGGKGTKVVECQTCKTTSRLPRCPKCRGTGLRMEGICGECEGTGKVRCKYCKGKGCGYCDNTGKSECKACGGTGKQLTSRKCPLCRGTGILGGKACPQCLGKGKPICPDCRGTGRLECPDCKGTGEVTIPCRKCNETGKLKCQKCQGSGKR